MWCSVIGSHLWALALRSVVRGTFVFRTFVSVAYARAVLIGAVGGSMGRGAVFVGFVTVFVVAVAHADCRFRLVVEVGTLCVCLAVVPVASAVGMVALGLLEIVETLAVMVVDAMVPSGM